MQYAEDILGPLVSSPVSMTEIHPPIPHPRIIDFGEFCRLEYELRSLPMEFDDLECLDLVEFYVNLDQTLLLQAKCLMPFERTYVLNLVAIIIGTLTKIRVHSVTTVSRNIVDSAWESLCRLGIKLPILKKLVATVMSEAREGGTEEGVESSQATSNQLGRMGFYCDLNKSMLPYVELYKKHDPTLMIQTERLMPFVRSYILQLVATIVGTLTRTSMGGVTPERRTIVKFCWESLCRLGIQLPVLEKLVASSQRPILVVEPLKGIQEAAKSWRALSDEVDTMRKVLASKEEELHNKYNEEGKASIEIPSSLRQLFDEVEHMRRLVASKEEELQNTVEVFYEKEHRRNDFDSLTWCSLE
ncbi:hypothetical protein TorRG33x02_019810 [Trema orientale]|uniref:Uncharacterized protein n=1 Tax=Trema orientale TaxID=63057 RepID=A0A2P5FWR2_TREOI|nr:hypothetical protein TorRG33x02_019810 [Trema orientale]